MIEQRVGERTVTWLLVNQPESCTYTFSTYPWRVDTVEVG